MMKLKQLVILLGIVLSSEAASLARSQSTAPAPAPASKWAVPPKTQADPPKAATKPKGPDDPSLVGYIIGEQDVLDIDVWQEKELSGPAVVRPE